MDLDLSTCSLRFWLNTPCRSRIATIVPWRPAWIRVTLRGDHSGFGTKAPAVGSSEAQIWAAAPVCVVAQHDHRPACCLALRLRTRLTLAHWPTAQSRSTCKSQLDVPPATRASLRPQKPRTSFFQNAQMLVISLLLVSRRLLDNAQVRPKPHGQLNGSTVFSLPILK